MGPAARRRRSCRTRTRTTSPGLALLLDRYRVDRVLRARDARPGTGLRRVARSAGRPGAPARCRSRPAIACRSTRSRCASCGRSAARCPSEPPDSGTGINNVSVVLLGVIGERRFLLAGDVEQDIDPSLLDGGLAARRPAQGRPSRQPDRDDAMPSSPPSGRGSRSPRPGPAIRTVTRRERTLERLAESGARVFRTDVDGTVTVDLRARRADGPDTSRGARRRRVTAVGRRPSVRPTSTAPERDVPLRRPRLGTQAPVRRRRAAAPPRPQRPPAPPGPRRRAARARSRLPSSR